MSMSEDQAYELPAPIAPYRPSTQEQLRQVHADLEEVKRLLRALTPPPAYPGGPPYTPGWPVYPPYPQVWCQV